MTKHFEILCCVSLAFGSVRARPHHSFIPMEATSNNCVGNMCSSEPGSKPVFFQRRLGTKGPKQQSQCSLNAINHQRSNTGNVFYVRV